ncbi:MAG TPA: hypothetical protein DCE42_27615 [Myxococcales bacterium]|nr:hypothetical protein [Deltaproteobacteria bacterium]MBU54511.1 hypothetical protein [Deltaproteobacteria bacterium]HAA58562.1 hypothetical protein [Myxococcales bacterium]
MPCQDTLIHIKGDNNLLMETLLSKSNAKSPPPGYCEEIAKTKEHLLSLSPYTPHLTEHVIYIRNFTLYLQRHKHHPLINAKKTPFHL